MASAPAAVWDLTGTRAALKAMSWVLEDFTDQGHLPSFGFHISGLLCDTETNFWLILTTASWVSAICS